jgi:hypothetical protein
VLARAIQDDDTETLSAILNALKTDAECQIVLQLILMQPCDDESTLLTRITQNEKTAAFTILCDTLKDQPKLLEAILTQPNNHSDTQSTQDTNTAVFKTMIDSIYIDTEILKAIFQPPNEENFVPFTFEIQTNPFEIQTDVSEITNDIRIMLTKIATSGRLNEVIDEFKKISKF